MREVQPCGVLFLLLLLTLFFLLFLLLLRDRLHGHDGQGGEDPVDGIQFEGHRGEAPRFGRGAPHRPGEVRGIGGGEHLVDEPGVLAVDREPDIRLFDHGAVPHQSALQGQSGRSPVADRDARVDAAILAAHRDQGIPNRGTVTDPGDPVAWDVQAQDPTNGTGRAHRDRSDDLSPAAVGGDGEFAQGVHDRAGAQGAVVAHLQIRGQAHQGPCGDGVAVLIVEVDGGTDRIGARVHQGQRGRDEPPIGEVGKVQVGHRRDLGRNAVGTGAGRAHRAQMEDVDPAVDQTGNRVGAVGRSGRNPLALAVNPVLVMLNPGAALAGRRTPS